MKAKAYKGNKVLEFNDCASARDALAKAGYVFKKPVAKKVKKAE